MTASDPHRVSRRRLVKGIGVGTAAALAGCTGGGGGGGDTTASGDDTQTKASTKAPTMWNAAFQGTENKPWKEWFVQEYEKRFGRDIKVSAFEYPDARQKYLTGGRTGDPDVIEGVLSHLSEFAKADLLEPIGDRAKQLDHYDGFVESALDAMRFKGNLYGLPYTGNGRALVYRKDIFDEMGFEPPETADEFLEIGREIQKSRDDVNAFHNCTKEGSVRAFQEWISHVYQHEDNLYALDGGSWKLVPSADTLGLIFDKFYYQVWASDQPLTDPKQRGTGWQVNDPGYLNGNFAMIECGPWLRGWTSGDDINDSEKTKELLDEKTRIAHLPYAEGGSKGSYLEVKPVMLNKHSEQKDAAWDALGFFASPDNLAKGREYSAGDYITPVHEEVESTLEDEDWMPFTDVFKTGKALAKISWGPVRQSFYKYMQRVVYGKLEPYKAGEQFHSELKSLESQV